MLHESQILPFLTLLGCSDRAHLLNEEVHCDGAEEERVGCRGATLNLLESIYIMLKAWWPMRSALDMLANEIGEQPGYYSRVIGTFKVELIISEYCVFWSLHKNNRHPKRKIPAAVAKYCAVLHHLAQFNSETSVSIVRQPAAMLHL